MLAPQCTHGYSYSKQPRLFIYYLVCAFSLCPHQAQRQNPLPEAEKKQRLGTLDYIMEVSHPRHSPVSHKPMKCLCVKVIWGRPRGERAPPLNQSSKKKEAGGEGRGEHDSTNGHKCLCSQETGRGGEPPATIMGSGETGCSPGLKEMLRGSLQHPALRWWNGVGEQGHLWTLQRKRAVKGGLGTLRRMSGPLSTCSYRHKRHPKPGDIWKNFHTFCLVLPEQWRSGEPLIKFAMSQTSPDLTGFAS